MSLAGCGEIGFEEDGLEVLATSLCELEILHDRW